MLKVVTLIEYDKGNTISEDGDFYQYSYESYEVFKNILKIKFFNFSNLLFIFKSII